MQVFSTSSHNFWLMLLMFGFSVAGLIGIDFPQSPEDLANGVATGLNAGNIFSLFGLIATSIAGPVIQYIKKKPKVTVNDFLGSVNFWIYFGGFTVGILSLIGINIPAGTPQAIADAVLTKQWGALLTIVIASILNPLIRWFKDKRAGATVSGAANDAAR